MTIYLSKDLMRWAAEMEERVKKTDKDSVVGVKDLRRRIKRMEKKMDRVLAALVGEDA